MSRAWATCSRVGCSWFSVKQYGSHCGNCECRIRGVGAQPDAEIDETLLLRSRERLTKELARIDERLAELALLKKGSG